MTPAGFLLMDAFGLFPQLSLDGGIGYVSSSAIVSPSTSWRQWCGTNTVEGKSPCSFTKYSEGIILLCYHFFHSAIITYDACSDCSNSKLMV